MWSIVLRSMMFVAFASDSFAEDKRVISNDGPSLEFLEYLGTMVEQDDELIGPGDLVMRDADPFPDSILMKAPPRAKEEEVSEDE